MVVKNLLMALMGGILFQKMKILYGKGFTGTDLERWRAAVFQNTITSMKAVCQACEDLGLYEEVSVSLDTIDRSVLTWMFLCLFANIGAMQERVRGDDG